MEKISKRAIHAFARQVAKEFKPDKIILFGSYAYGKPNEDSDVDILIVMPFVGRSAKKATEIWMATQPKFPIDILVRTQEQINTRVELGDFFMRRIINRGKALYESGCE
jgi:predicted nucleotidyltransferase